MRRASMHPLVRTPSTTFACTRCRARRLSPCLPLPGRWRRCVSLQQFYFGDGVHVRLKSCISLLHDRLLALPDAANVAIAFPDEGAYKRCVGER